MHLPPMRSYAPMPPAFPVPTRYSVPSWSARNPNLLPAVHPRDSIHHPDRPASRLLAGTAPTWMGVMG